MGELGKMGGMYEGMVKCEEEKKRGDVMGGKEMVGGMWVKGE